MIETPTTDVLALDDPSAVCPDCGGEVFAAHYPETFAVPEAWVKRCHGCDWEGEPE